MIRKEKKLLLDFVALSELQRVDHTPMEFEPVRHCIYKVCFMRVHKYVVVHKYTLRVYMCASVYKYDKIWKLLTGSMTSPS